MQSRISSRRMVLVSTAALGALVLGRSASAQGVLPIEPEAEVARIEDTGSFVPVVFEGFVLEPDGAPAEGAVVVSSAGGKAVTDWNGHYRLEARAPLDAESVQITAVGRGGGNRLASTSVDVHSSGFALVSPHLLVQGSTCVPSWLPTFGPQPGTNRVVRALTVFDDGSGPSLYAAGAFTVAPGGVPAARVAKWDGSSWADLGSGIGGSEVIALTVFDDGSGPALYAGGGFTTAGGVAANNIAKWNGSSWAALGSGRNGAVKALTVYDDGSGPALYAGGRFSNVIAKWNGSTWAALGSGITGGFTPEVFALTVYDDGSGPALYAGGSFTTAGGVAASNIAKWNGLTWAALGSGMNSFVFALTVYDNGSGPALYAGGSFTTAGGVATSRLAKWNGSSWTAFGGGMNGTVRALTVYDDGSGPALHAGGGFTTAGGVAANRIARWGGSGWLALGNGMTDDQHASVSADVQSLAGFDDGSGPALYAGGFFSAAGIVPADCIAKWNASSWSAFGNGIGGVVPIIASLAVFDDGSGPALYAGGSFMGAGGVIENNIAKWDGSSWAALGSGIQPESELFTTVSALTVFDDGSGPALYAGGHFTSAGGVAANRIAKWNGSGWSALGSGVSGSSAPKVQSLAVFDDGSGLALYAGGLFTTAGGVAASNIAKWNGSSWAALGSGANSSVDALTVFDDGSGPALYAGGCFTTAGGVTVNRVARWNGSSWAALGVGVSSSCVRALTVFDDGSGPALIAGGLFTTAGGTSANRIAKWDGSSWSALGTGISHEVRALTVYDDGSGPELYAGGLFTTAGGTAANRIARWDGSNWAALDGGISIEGSEGVHSLAAFDDGGGSALFAGGDFETALDSGDSFLAKWACAPDTTPPTLFCPPYVLEIDRLGSPPGEVVTFTVTATDDRDPSPSVACVPPSGSLFPRGTSLVTCTATDASGNQSTCQFPVTVQIKARRR